MSMDSLSLNTSNFYQKDEKENKNKKNKSDNFLMNAIFGKSNEKAEKTEKDEAKEEIQRQEEKEAREEGREAIQDKDTVYSDPDRVFDRIKLFEAKVIKERKAALKERDEKDSKLQLAANKAHNAAQSYSYSISQRLASMKSLGDNIISFPSSLSVDGFTFQLDGGVGANGEISVNIKSPTYNVAGYGINTSRSLTNSSRISGNTNTEQTTKNKQ